MDAEQEKALQLLIAHADRMWKAEEQNAARLAARTNLVLTGVTAIIGLKVFSLGKELDVVLNAPLSVPLVFFWQCLAGSTGCLACALWIALDTRLGTSHFSSSASEDLWLDQKVVDLVLTQDDAPERKMVPGMVFSATQEAALDLQDRNARRGVAIMKAQTLFFVAVGFAITSMILYTWVKCEQTAQKSVETIRVVNERGAQYDHHDNGQDRCDPGEQVPIR
ncbi:MAG: hypothetical protein KF864_02270 [Phycisphaeraceae bacterium]|nr:hypothetical protein [Phycisphaeraceae bacterium]